MGVDLFISYWPDGERKHFQEVSHLFWRRNWLMHDICGDHEITKDFLVKKIKELSDSLSEEDDTEQTAEAILFCSYLLCNNEFPIWVEYT